MKILPPFKLIPEPLNDDARQAMQPVSFAVEEIGKRHRLGGKAEFLRNEEVPACPQCREPMTFYLKSMKTSLTPYAPFVVSLKLMECYCSATEPVETAILQD